MDSAEDLDIFMAMYYLLECNENYCVTWASFSNYYRGELNDDTNANKANNYRINSKKTTANISF